jgi:hypothetical protein
MLESLYVKDYAISAESTIAKSFTYRDSSMGDSMRCATGAGHCNALISCAVALLIGYRALASVPFAAFGPGP